MTDNIRIDPVFPVPKATFRQTRTPLKIERLQKGREDHMGWGAVQSGVVFAVWVIDLPPNFEGGIWSGGREDSCRLEPTPFLRTEIWATWACKMFRIWNAFSQTNSVARSSSLASLICPFLHPFAFWVVPQSRPYSQSGPQKVRVHTFWINWLYLKSTQPFLQRLSLVQLGWGFWSRGLEISGLLCVSCPECKLFEGRAVFPSSWDTWHIVDA